MAQKSMRFNDVATVTVGINAYRIHFFGMNSGKLWTEWKIADLFLKMWTILIMKKIKIKMKNKTK